MTTTTTTTMQAVVQHRYGGPEVLEHAQVRTPTLARDEVLMRVAAVGLNAADWHLMRGEPALVRLAIGLRRPRQPVLGSDVAGVVEAVGSAVTDLRPGDAVMAEVDRGGLAELVAVRARFVARVPAGLTFEEAAALPMAGMTALQGLRVAGRVGPGQRVLVHGASGGVGTFAVQMAAALGAEVTAGCSTRNVAQARALGAASAADPPRALRAGRGPADRLVRHRPPARAARSFPVHQAVARPARGRPGARRARGRRALVEQGVVRPVIERVYPIAEARAAVAHVDGGHARGKVVVRVAP